MTDNSKFPFTFNQDACATCRGTCCRWEESYYSYINDAISGDIRDRQGRFC